MYLAQPAIVGFVACAILTAAAIQIAAREWLEYRHESAALTRSG
jgi:hypothetical protein